MHQKLDGKHVLVMCVECFVIGVLLTLVVLGY